MFSDEVELLDINKVKASNWSTRLLLHCFRLITTQKTAPASKTHLKRNARQGCHFHPCRHRMMLKKKINRQQQNQNKKTKTSLLLPPPPPTATNLNGFNDISAGITLQCVSVYPICALGWYSVDRGEGD